MTLGGGELCKWQSVFPHPLDTMQGLLGRTDGVKSGGGERIGKAFGIVLKSNRQKD